MKALIFDSQFDQFLGVVIYVRVVEGHTGPIQITRENLADILGAPHFESELAMRTSVPGVATGLAWTPVGGDILFIDSSDTVKIGGDVNYLFLEVLPRLKPGVIVHVHDIFLPFDYRRDWVMEKFRFWTEQYMLQSFLTFNSEFEVLMANSYLNHYHEEELKTVFPDLPSYRGGSFWIRRKPNVAPVT